MDDVDKFTDESIWAADIIIREWVFKKTEESKQVSLFFIMAMNINNKQVLYNANTFNMISFNMHGFNQGIIMLKK